MSYLPPIKLCQYVYMSIECLFVQSLPKSQCKLRQSLPESQSKLRNSSLKMYGEKVIFV